MSKILFKFPCGLEIEVEARLVKGLEKEGRIYCPTHGKRCYRRQQKVAKLRNYTKPPEIYTPN